MQLPRIQLARRRVALGAILLASALLAGCSSSDAESTAGDRDGARLSVVASTSVIAEFARSVAGPDADVVMLVPPGADLHTFDPPVEAAKQIVRADVLLVNGCDLEQKLLDVIALNRADGSILTVVGAFEGDATADSVAAGAAASCDPHRWLDARLAARYIDAIEQAFTAADAAHAGGYQERAGVARAALLALDDELRETLAAIPTERRRIVVLHDAFSYFAAAYGFELVASILPTGSGQDPSAGAVADVIELVRAQGVDAVFAEPQFPSRVVELVGEEAGARVLTLYSIPLPGEAETYPAMMRANARALVEGLSE